MSSDNLESGGYLELGSQELNNMVMSVFEQSTVITQSSISDSHDTDRSQIHGFNKENVCPRHSFIKCKGVINDYGDKTKEECLKFNCKTVMSVSECLL